MIDTIIFDLDGVLVDAKKIHYEALNEALGAVDNKYIINKNEHHLYYDGLKTYEKLSMLTKQKGLPKELHETIWLTKQDKTIERISKLNNNSQLIDMFDQIKGRFKIACCSNSIRKSVNTMLSKIGIIQYFDLILSNEDVQSAKPFPEIYWKAMSILKSLPDNTLIVEDSPNGLRAAELSGAKIYRVNNPTEVNIENINNRIDMEKIMIDKNTKWTDKKLNVLIPMAGAGSRFEKAGYTFPKPLIEINNQPMIQLVVDNLNFDANYIFIVQKSHRRKYNLDTVLPLIAHSPTILEVDGITEGAACTTLIAETNIDNDHPLIIANSDQYLEWNTSQFMYKMQEQNADAGIVTFKSKHPKWSYAKIGPDGYVTEVAEKKPISDIATVGVYYWKKGSDYVKYAKQMIKTNKRHNNEFYVCPVFNEAIQDGKKILTFDIKKMWGIGTPEDLQTFINHRNT